MTHPPLNNGSAAADEHLILTESALVAAVLVGISGESDAVPRQDQLDRVLRLAKSSSERIKADGTQRLLSAIKDVR